MSTDTRRTLAREYFGQAKRSTRRAASMPCKVTRDDQRADAWGALDRAFRLIRLHEAWAPNREG